MAVLLFHKPLSSFDHFAWIFRVLEFGYWTSVFTVTFGYFSEVLNCLFHYLFLQSNWRFSIFSVISSGRGKFKGTLRTAHLWRHLNVTNKRTMKWTHTKLEENKSQQISRWRSDDTQPRNFPDEMVMDDKQLCAFSATRNGKTILSERGCKNFKQSCELAWASWCYDMQVHNHGNHSLCVTTAGSLLQGPQIEGHIVSLWD